MIEVLTDNGEKIIIEIFEKAYPHAQNEFDADFLRASIFVKTSNFQASLNFMTRCSEINYWCEKISQLCAFRITELEMFTIEEDVKVNLLVNELGTVTWFLNLNPVNSKNKLFLQLETGISEVDQFKNQLILSTSSFCL